ncbi:MAG: DinB family protein [Sphingobacteriales bacterium]
MDKVNYIRILDQNSSDTLQLAKSFSPAQLSSRKKSEWSIMQILEHLCIVDKICYVIISRPSDKIAETNEIIGNHQLKVLVADQRDKKVESPEILRPRGTITDVPVFEKIFLQQRNLLKEDILAGKIIIDNRIHQHSFLGEMTISDWLNFIVHHTQRHLEQIKEVITWSEKSTT